MIMLTWHGRLLIRIGNVLGPEVVLIYVYRVLREYARVLDGKMRETGVSWRAETRVRKLEFLGKNARRIEAAIWQSRATTTRGSVLRARTSRTSLVDYLTSAQTISSDISLLNPTPFELSLHGT